MASRHAASPMSRRRITKLYSVIFSECPAARLATSSTDAYCAEHPRCVDTLGGRNKQRGFRKAFSSSSCSRTHGINTDSAVPADAISEEQTFRSEVNGSLPLSEH